MRDYEYLTKEYFIAKLYFRYNNGELEKININKFD